jgi:hypothetical protein
MMGAGARVKNEALYSAKAPTNCKWRTLMRSWRPLVPGSTGVKAPKTTEYDFAFKLFLLLARKREKQYDTLRYCTPEDCMVIARFASNSDYFYSRAKPYKAFESFLPLRNWPKICYFRPERQPFSRFTHDWGLGSPCLGAKFSNWGLSHISVQRVAWLVCML